MITLFRRIRQKLIDSGSASKYLLYAIGEILLVVIGILIALQVNNWNEERGNKSKEFQYLNGIYMDLNSQIESLNRTIKINERSIATVHGLLKEYIRLDGFQKSDSIFSRINAITRSAAPRAVTTTFSELMYGAQITLIRNERLRNEIVLFYQELEQMIQSSNNNAEAIYQNQIFPIFFKRTISDLAMINDFFDEVSLELSPLSGSYSSRTKDLAFNNLNNPDMQLEFINALNMKAIVEALQLERSKQIVASAEQLKSMIEIEIQENHSQELGNDPVNP